MTDGIVVRVDGGICSQIAFVALGLELQDRGYRVKYDLSFFHKCGTDLTGNFARNWDMGKAFPSLKLEEALPEEAAALRRSYKRRSDLVDSFRPPLYVGGYPPCSESIISHLGFLRDSFRPEFDAPFRALVHRIVSGGGVCSSCTAW